MDTTSLIDLLTLALGLGLALTVAWHLGRGLGSMWAPERVITQTTVRMMRITFQLVATAAVLAEVVVLPPQDLVGSPPSGAGDVILAVTMRLGAACLTIGLLYLAPVLAGLRWRGAERARSGAGMRTPETSR